MAEYELALVLAGLAVLGAVALPRLLSGHALSFPILYVAFGLVVFSLPVGFEIPDPITHSDLTERLTEFVVIVALMGAGLKLDRPFDVGAWSNVWRLLAVTMPLTIVATAALGFGALGVLLPTAILLGAVIAPTDPVLASDVQASPPTKEVVEEIDPKDQEQEVRFTLTGEAGLNDGLAFPFTHLALATATAMTAESGSLDWLVEWFAVHVVYEILVGVVVGYVCGQAVARLIFRGPVTTNLGKVMEGAEALAATLVTYGVAELLHGYGFIAVFVAALELRHFEWEHDYYLAIHDYAVMTERVVVAGILFLFGGAIAAGLFDPLTLVDVAFCLALVFVVRPLAGALALLGSSIPWAERLVVSGFGIRGIGSFYYLAFALNEGSFSELEMVVSPEKIWALVGFIVAVSIVVHGITVTPVMEFYEGAMPDGSESPPSESSTRR